MSKDRPLDAYVGEIVVYSGDQRRHLGVVSHFIVESRYSTGYGGYVLAACKESDKWVHAWFSTRKISVYTHLTCEKCRESWEWIEHCVEEQQQ